MNRDAKRRLEGYPRVRLLAPMDGEIEAAVADGFGPRLKGLAWLPAPPPMALLIPHCASVHTFGMRFAIDVAFLEWPPGPGRAVEVLAVRERVKRRRTFGVSRRARTVPRSRVAALELAAGRAAELGLELGVELREVSHPAD